VLATFDDVEFGSFHFPMNASNHISVLKIGQCIDEARNPWKKDCARFLHVKND